MTAGIERRTVDVFQASQRIARYDVRESTLALDVVPTVATTAIGTVVVPPLYQ